VTNFHHFLAPFPTLDAIVPHIKFFADNGARGVCEQGAHTGRGSEFVGLRSWVLAKAAVKEAASGEVWNAGVWRSSARSAPVRLRVSAPPAKDGKWRAYDLGVFRPEEGDRFSIAAVPAACSEVLIDCLWLEEMPD